MERKALLTTTAAFVVVAVTGGVWIGFAGSLGGTKPGLMVSVLGGVFSVAFIWLLIERLRSLLAHPERRYVELALLAFNLLILIATFAWIHKQIGLMDVSGPAPRPTNDFGDAFYFSVVTSTTLGYGDFIPLAPGRPIAAIQAFVGYFILGVLVSTGYQIIAPHTQPAQQIQDERSEDPEAEDGKE